MNQGTGYGQGRRAGVITCAELHASCATNSVERRTVMCAVTDYTLTDSGT